MYLELNTIQPFIHSRRIEIEEITYQIVIKHEKVISLDIPRFQILHIIIEC